MILASLGSREVREARRAEAVIEARVAHDEAHCTVRAAHGRALGRQVAAARDAGVVIHHRQFQSLTSHQAAFLPSILMLSAAQNSASAASQAGSTVSAVISFISPRWQIVSDVVTAT